MQSIMRPALAHVSTQLIVYRNTNDEHGAKIIHCFQLLSTHYDGTENHNKISGTSWTKKGGFADRSSYLRL